MLPAANGRVQLSLKPYERNPRVSLPTIQDPMKYPKKLVITFSTDIQNNITFVNDISLHVGLLLSMYLPKIKLDMKEIAPPIFDMMMREVSIAIYRSLIKADSIDMVKFDRTKLFRRIKQGLNNFFGAAQHAVVSEKRCSCSCSSHLHTKQRCDMR